MKTVLGIDIGFSGGLAFYNEEELITHRMPIYKVKKGNALDVKKLSDIIKSDIPDHVYIEKAMMMPVSGKIAYQKLGQQEGAITGILCALDIPYTIVAPATWKKVMKCPKDKDASRMRASQLLPAYAHCWDKKCLDGIAEASLIALYGYNHG